MSKIGREKMKIAVVGGVAAGMSAAAKAKRLDKDLSIVVYEKTDTVSFGACGLPYFVGDFFSDPDYMIARTAENFQKNGIDVNTKHKVLAVDFEKHKITVKNLKTEHVFEDSYDKLLIATGARADIPPIENVKLENVFTLRSMEDGLKLKECALEAQNQDIVVIGGGYIGIEVIEAMKKLEKNVRLIQLDERILPETFDKEMTDIMEEEIRNHGVKLHLSETVRGFIGEKRIQEVVSEKGRYNADMVVIATGAKPQTGFLRGSALKMLANGAIVINRYGETNISGVYSAGDCATVPHRILGHDYIPLATTANKLGRIVGENLGGKKVKFQGTLGSAAVKVMDLEAGRTGITEVQAQEKGLNYKTVFISDINQTNYYPGQSPIYVKLIYDADSKVILGGQVVGKKGAVLRVDVLATAIYKKMTTNELGMMDLCYAPPFARTWDVLNVVGNVAK
jgi:CoA-disulfide reductase